MDKYRPISRALSFEIDPPMYVAVKLDSDLVALTIFPNELLASNSRVNDVLVRNANRIEIGPPNDAMPFAKDD